MQLIKKKVNDCRLAGKVPTALKLFARKSVSYNFPSDRLLIRRQSQLAEIIGKILVSYREGASLLFEQNTQIISKMIK